MQKISLISLLCLTAVPALAADLPLKAPAPAQLASAYTWSGFYVGVNAGAVWGRSDQASTPNAELAVPGQIPVTLSFLVPSLRGTRDFDVKPTGGGQIGYNTQINQFVLGLEADINYVGLRNNFAITVPTSPVSSFEAAQSTSIDWLATFRGRAGLAFNNVLFYGTGGAAVGRARFDSAITVHTGAGFGDGFLNVSASETRTGWVAGGGAEYGLGRWSFRLEYLHVDLGSFTASAPFTGPYAVAPPPCINCFLNTNISLKADLVRLGANYRF
jgi:outer membrane immunogenic protein